MSRDPKLLSAEEANPFDGPYQPPFFDLDRPALRLVLAVVIVFSASVGCWAFIAAVAP